MTKGTKSERPQKGGSYLRQKDGSLKREAFTKPAAGPTSSRRRAHQRQAAPTKEAAPETAQPEAETQAKPAAKRATKES